MTFTGLVWYKLDIRDALLVKKLTSVHKIKHHIKARAHAHAVKKSAKKLNKTYDMHREAAGDFLGLPRLKKRKNQWMSNRALSHIALPILIIAVSASFAVGAEVATKSSTTSSPTVAASIPAVPANSVCRIYDSSVGLSAEDHRITITITRAGSTSTTTTFGGLKLNYVYIFTSAGYVYDIASVVNNQITVGGGPAYIKACALDPGPAMPPFTSRWNMVDQQYRDFFNRHATDSEQAYWAASGYTANQIIDYFTSQEAAQRGPIVRLYKAYYLRWPDAGGYNFWVAKLKSGSTLTNVSDAFSKTPEFNTRYGTLTNEQFVTLIYNNVMQRTPDPTGYAYWVYQLNTGKITRGGVMLKFSESNEFKKKFGLDSDLVGVTLRMYRRAATATELAQWNPDMTVDQLAYPIIFESTEYANRVVK